MTISNYAEAAVAAITETLGVTPSADQAKALDRTVQDAIIRAVLDERGRCAKVATNVCSADRDLAHKISDQIRRGEAALIANLSSLR
ncbi:MAG: hypothetical protein ACE5GT_04835 [Rhodospirillales bacterium]